MKKISYCVFFLCAVSVTQAVYSSKRQNQKDWETMEREIMNSQSMEDNFYVSSSKPQKEALNDGGKEIYLSKEEKERIEKEMMESQLMMGNIQLTPSDSIRLVQEGGAQYKEEQRDQEIMQIQNEPQKLEEEHGRDSILRAIQILTKQRNDLLCYLDAQEKEFAFQLEQIEFEIEKNKLEIEQNNSKMKRLTERKGLKLKNVDMERKRYEKKVDVVKLFHKTHITAMRKLQEVDEKINKKRFEKRCEMKELQEFDEKMKKQQEELQEKKAEINKERFKKCCERKKEIEKKEKWINYFEDKIKGVSEKIQSLPVKGQDVVGQNHPGTGGYNALADLRKKRCELMIKETILQDEFDKVFNDSYRGNHEYEKAKKKYNDSIKALGIKYAEETKGKASNLTYKLQMYKKYQGLAKNFSEEEERMIEKNSELNRQLEDKEDPKNPHSLYNLREEVKTCKEKIKLLKSKGSHMAKGRQSQEEEKSWR